MMFPRLFPLSFAALSACVVLSGMSCDEIDRRISISISNSETIASASTVTIDVATSRMEVDRIELYRGRHKMGEVSGSASYSYAWNVTVTDNGKHKWQAFAYDNDGFLWPSELIVAEVDISLSPRSPSGHPCADGIDCYCDKVKDSTHRFFDPDVALCEDFEAITLHDDTGPGDHFNAGGENVHGPWYDGTPDPNSRGLNSYWTHKYGGALDRCSWNGNEAPRSPQVGNACNYPTCFAAEFRADDLWEGNFNACIDIMQNGEFNAENLGIADPVVPGSHSGVFDGNQTFAHRIAKGNPDSVGGRGDFGGPLTTVGVTMAVAYPANSEASGVWDSPFKHNEWGGSMNGLAFDDGALMFHRASGGVVPVDPFDLFMFGAPDKGESDCLNALASATITRGTAACLLEGSASLVYAADRSIYDKSRDWPFGEWGCVQGYFQNLGSPNTRIQIWFNETLIIDISNLDGSILANRGGYETLFWNAFSNQNQFGLSTNATTHRYEDNVHVRNGPPVSCGQIGFPE